jgi:DNA primase
MIPQQFIEEVQSRTDIAELISSYVPLKRTGRNFKANCPFHGEKTPSFIVSPQKQIFHCFGCGEGGGVFQFVSLIEKVNFPEAVEILAKRVGLNIPYEKGQGQGAKTVLYEAMDEAALLYHDNLKNNKSCQQHLNYLTKRGIGDKTIDKFRIGYAPGNNFLLNHMRKKGFTLQILEKVSLITSTRGTFRDLFCDRITFPIFDVRSRIVGFGARRCRDSADSPKYINSLENSLYSKREHLFGLNFSKEDISKTGTMIVVEGYLDMIIPFMREVKNIVASLGTALTLEQIRLIKRYTSCVILIYDSDKAGQAATLRSLDLLLENDLKVEVVNLETGYDPDSLVRKKGQDYFAKLLEERHDFFEYKLGILSKSHDLNSIEGKSKIAGDMLATIDKLNSEIQKYEYIRKLAPRLGVKEEIVIAEFRNNFSKKTTKAYQKQTTYAAANSDNLSMEKNPLSVTEKVLIKSMLTNAKAFSLMRKNLKVDYFSSYLARKTVTLFFTTYPEDKELNLSQALGKIDDKEISGFVSKIIMDDDIPVNNDLFKECLLKLRKKGAIKLKKDLKDQIKEAEIKGDKSKLRELINKYGRINSEVRNG